MNEIQEVVMQLRCCRMKEGFLLWVDSSLAVNMSALKQRLFAWHKDSFYGTILELVEAGAGERSGILLPDTMAVRYLAEGITEAAVKLDYGTEIVLLRKAAQIMLRCLEEGRYAPDYRKWRQGRLGWRLTPEAEDAEAWAQVLEESTTVHADWLDEWLDGVLNGLTADNDKVNQAWEKLSESYPLLRTRGTAIRVNAAEQTDEPDNNRDVSSNGIYMDEEDWFIAIGWKKDEVPFRVALQLVEPEQEYGQEKEDWTLETVLLDRADNNVKVVWKDWMEQEILLLEDKELPEVLETIPASWIPLLKQRLSRERTRWLQAAPHLGENVQNIRRRLQEHEVWSFLTEDSVRLAEAGAYILLPSWWEAIQKQKVRLKAKVRSSVGTTSSMFGMDSILQFDWRLAIGEAHLTEEEFRRLAEQKRRLVQINGQWVLLDPAMLEQIRLIMKRVQKKKGLTFREAMELHLLGGSDIGGSSVEESGLESGLEGSSLRLEVELNEHLSKMVGQLQNTASIPIVGDPEGFNGELRRYQREGVAWLAFLRQFGLGGCLADDMGLGKTVQWIVYLLHLKQHGLLSSPALLICPTSVIGNWQMELARFAPELKVQLHYGTRRSKGEEFSASVEGTDVVITSYTLSHLDEDELSMLEWSTLCLDEAQNIKNAFTKQAAAIRALNARHRIALTGTPIENRLTELWSIFDYLNPGYLGSLGEFRRTFVSSIEKGDLERTQQVQQLVRPFLLRRIKKDPAIQLDLPDKNEMKTYVPLTVEQGALYESIIQDMFEKVDKLSPMERRGLILATLTRLKQVCDHPDLLVKKDGDNRAPAARSKSRGMTRGESPLNKETAASSSKLARLLEMVEELRSEGDKCLIFTQFVEMGHILQHTLQKERGEEVLFLHGGVPKAKRDEIIARFQNEEEAGIFVLSLKAGGTGLNLTAANHVFHFDRWWNPAVENQATDRAFRIGQTRDVQVHKFISLGTLEERIDQMIDKKQGLSQQIIGSGEGWITEMSTDELRELFSLRRQWMQD
jgi:SNF2 family DNA or RNA helicase